MSEKKSQNIEVNEHVGAETVFEVCTALLSTKTQEEESLINCCKESQIESLDQRHKAIPGQSIMEKWHGYS